MIHYSVRCDSLPGKEEEFDSFLTGEVKKFWLGQTGVKGYHVYGDKLMGWPERTIDIEVQDFATLQRIFDSNERRQLRKQFLGYAARAESQILEEIT